MGQREGVKRRGNGVEEGQDVERPALSTTSQLAQSASLRARTGGTTFKEIDRGIAVRETGGVGKASFSSSQRSGGGLRDLEARESRWEEARSRETSALGWLVDLREQE